MKNLTTLVFVLLSLSAIAQTSKETQLLAKKNPARKIIIDSSRVKEVLTSQQLFLVKSSTKTERTSDSIKKKTDFKYELRGAFMVVYMDKDTTYTVTDWVRAPDGELPEMRTYYYGTASYKNLDKLIAKAKKNSIMLSQKDATLTTAMAKAIEINNTSNLNLPQLDTTVTQPSKSTLNKQRKVSKTHSEKPATLALPKHINPVQNK